MEKKSVGKNVRGRKDRIMNEWKREGKEKKRKRTEQEEVSCWSITYACVEVSKLCVSAQQAES